MTQSLSVQQSDNGKDSVADEEDPFSRNNSDHNEASGPVGMHPGTFISIPRCRTNFFVLLLPEDFPSQINILSSLFHMTTSMRRSLLNRLGQSHHRCQSMFSACLVTSGWLNIAQIMCPSKRYSRVKLQSPKAKQSALFKPGSAVSR